MIFKFKIKEKNGRIKLTFGKKVKPWKRFASQIINDNVILDVKNARKFLKAKGNKEVYRVFHFDANGLSCDFTLLRHGIFSTSSIGEPFLTYGHLHEKNMGEAYSVLKNDCFFELTDKRRFETFIVYLKKEDSIFIHPRFLHRIISYKKDCLVLNFVPKEAGHNYNIIKNKGFPVHLIYYLKDGTIALVKNKKYRKVKFNFVKRIKTKVDPIRVFGKNPENLKKILENPKKYEKFYF